MINFTRYFLLQGLARVSASVGHATIIWGNKHTAVSFRFDTRSLCQRLYVLARFAFRLFLLACINCQRDSSMFWQELHFSSFYWLELIVNATVLSSWKKTLFNAFLCYIRESYLSLVCYLTHKSKVFGGIKCKYFARDFNILAIFCQFSRILALVTVKIGTFGVKMVSFMADWLKFPY